MNRIVFALSGAAVVVVAAVLALGLYFNQPGVGGAPSPSPTPSPTAAPTTAVGATLPPEEARLEPGRYAYEEEGTRYTIEIRSAGWASLGGWGVIRGAEQNDPPDLATLGFWGNPRQAYRDPCQWTGTEIDTGRTAEDMAAVLAGLEAFDPSAPADATVGGYSGKRVVLTVPSDIEWSVGDTHFPQCQSGEYRSFAGRHYQGAGQVDEVWLLDVEGDRRVVLISYFPTTSQEVKAELAQMVESMQIEPAAP